MRDSTPRMGRPVTLPPQVRLITSIAATTDEALRARARQDGIPMTRIVDAALRKYLGLPDA